MASSSLSTPYLVLSGVIVISLAGIVAFLQPAVAGIQALRADNAATQVQLAERQAFLETLDRKVAALAREGQHERQLNVVLPVKERQEDVVRLVHQAQQVSGGTIQRISNISANVQGALNAQRARGEADRLAADVTPLGIEVEFRGSYQQLRVLMEQLVAAPRLLDIVSLEITRNEEVLDEIGVVLRMQFYQYRSRNE